MGVCRVAVDRLMVTLVKKYKAMPPHQVSHPLPVHRPQ